jgi:hypothetical protein
MDNIIMINEKCLITSEVCRFRHTSDCPKSEIRFSGLLFYTGGHSVGGFLRVCLFGSRR